MMNIDTPLLLSTLFFIVFLSQVAPINALAPPAEVIIGAQFPLHKVARFNFIEDGGGRRRLAAFLLAVDQINDKNDGFYDDLLPNTVIKFAKYDSKRNEGEAVVNAFYIWEKAQAKVAIGPASSGPSKQSQSVFKLSHVNIPQVSYSATSSQLSDASASPMFMRTAPSDVYQAEIMVSTAELQGWTKLCVMVR
jgi:ABC-type branched-subunit amino acid transport system substrate-binding protein